MADKQNSAISTNGTFGPFLFARGSDDKTARLAALVVTQEGDDPAEFRIMDQDIVTPAKLATRFGRDYWRYDFELPVASDARYSFDTETYHVNTDMTHDLRIGFVSCNGQEDGDLDRPLTDRNALWIDLGHEHEKRPFSLLLHGGDQIYADGVWECHPDIVAWQKVQKRQKLATDFTPDMHDGVLKFYLEHYLEIYGQPQISHMLARVPSLMMWDDHDIFDGWGSHKKWFHDSMVAKGMFDCAREAFCLMQLCTAPDDLAGKIIDRSGESLGWRTDFPRFSVIAPDLRSERTPHEIMGEHGWRDMIATLDTVPEHNRILLMSSVPVIGPRLSLVEAILHLMPSAQKYEDDLRDQWQSRWHRKEWCRFLETLEDVANDRNHDITLLSGEIHVATRGTFETRGKTIHQLVASGISHTAPPVAFARALGLLAWIGDNPLPGRPTKLKPLPGRFGTYCAARNYLTLDREDENWRANWHLENIGWTPDLKI
ncbi:MULTISPECIES: alkaline phosphatase D family protein [Thalassospira]|uniref:PhoD-like phosphatase n=1 Tax=Thalassospira xiamenensis TaxID=220697 RepID=A0A285T857_9PROT|nr:MULTISPECIES: alkaline phosphatase D family protein [Thalassospira]MBO9506871.1 alkaline phosphatase family protein [Thalassospira sp. A3_1]SOC17643.1 PhoD-like phosphatase [Thalassospira xiamenensis]